MKNRDLLNVYRDLRNKLLQFTDHQNFVCVVSAMADNDDTGLLAMNLAAVFAFERSRSVLIVDCDTEWSILDEICADEDEIGLIDFIEGDMEDISRLIHESGINRVQILPSGNPSDTRTEAFESERMREIILELKKQYSDRYIVINAPSMRLSSEVQILANLSDMLIFEVRSGSVLKEKITDSIEMIGLEKVAGVILRES
jgi:protein-tyrosine kinase